MQLSHPIVGNVFTAVVTAAVLGAFAWITGMVGQGSKAGDIALIRTVVAEEMQTDEGKSHAARLHEIGGTLINVETRLKTAQEDVSDLEDAVYALASE